MKIFINISLVIFLFTGCNNSEEQLIKLGLNDRQLKAVLFIKEKGKITNKEYQELNDCSRNTASNDLGDLVQKNILVGSDVKGAGAFYQLKSIEH